MIRVNKNLTLFSGLFFFLGTVLFFTLQKIYPLIGHATYYCQSFINDTLVSVPNFFSSIPFILLSVILVFSLIKLILMINKVHFLSRSLRAKAVTRRNVTQLTKKLGLENRLIITRSKSRFAFCTGIINPKIYVSTALITELDKKELEAVLRHEQYHLANYDTFIMIFASVIRSLFPFFPLVGDLIKKYRIEREIQADDFAVKIMADTYPLISALKKFLAFPTVDTISLAAIADEDTLEPRIYSLLKKKYSYRQFRKRHVLITVVSIFLLGITLIAPVQAKEIHHQEYDVMMLCTTNGSCMNTCSSEKNMKKIYSEMPASKTMNQSTTSKPFSPIK